MKKITKLFLILAWASFILAVLTYPAREYEVKIFTWYDKLAHLLLFGFLNYLIIRFGLEFKKLKISPILLISTFLTAAYAIFGEYLQNFVPGRTVSEWDFLAGFLGALVIDFIFKIYFKYFKKPKNRLLLHICCIGCGVHVSQVLKNDFEVDLYFYNPNIFPEEEYFKRLEEIRKVADKYKLKVTAEEYDHESWKHLTKGHEADKEGGERCKICYLDRLEKTASQAKLLGYTHFTSTLSVSPHKNSLWLGEIGNSLAKKYSIKFLDQDFKKNDGFKKASALSRELGLYRQNYCGCEFSIRKQKTQ